MKFSSAIDHWSIFTTNWRIINLEHGSVRKWNLNKTIEPTTDWDSTVNDMVYVEMIEPLALKLHIPLECYCCWQGRHLSWYLACLHRCHRRGFQLAADLIVATMDLNWRNYATFCIAVREFRISNRNVQSFSHFTKYTKKRNKQIGLFPHKNKSRNVRQNSAHK